MAPFPGLFRILTLSDIISLFYVLLHPQPTIARYSMYVRKYNQYIFQMHLLPRKRSLIFDDI